MKLWPSWILILPVLVIAGLYAQPPDQPPDPPSAPESIQPTWDPPPPPPELYPGQSTHAQPPEGWQCMRQNVELSVPADHVCTCERMYAPDDPTVIQEDRECSVWCHPDSCRCGVSGKPANPAGLAHP